VGKFLKKRAALALYVVIRSHFLSFIYSNEIKNENTNYKFSVFFPSIPHHQCCHIKKYLPFLFLPLPSKGRKRFWDMATLVMGNRGEENGKLIIRVFIFDFITINET
jgi:hypothetical protein